MARSL
jgi:hypothetical protein